MHSQILKLNYNFTLISHVHWYTSSYTQMLEHVAGIQLRNNLKFFVQISECKFCYRWKENLTNYDIYEIFRLIMIVQTLFFTSFTQFLLWEWSLYLKFSPYYIKNTILINWDFNLIFQKHSSLNLRRFFYKYNSVDFSWKQLSVCISIIDNKMCKFKVEVVTGTCYWSV